MDSLLLVLAVIGVIMVLAGIARMRSKRRRYGWGDIDHSVLFSKVGRNTDSAEEFISHQEPQLGENLDRYAEDVDPTPAINSTVGVEDRIDPVATTARPHRSRSLFGKLKKDKPEPAVADESSTVQKYKQGAPDRVVVLNVMAPEGQHFLGATLVEAVQSLGLSFGEMDIFHQLKNGVPIYSLVNMIKPGSFDLHSIDAMTTPGVSFFVQLPNQYGNAVEVFDNMVMTAQHLADILGGELRDERRSVLTNSATDYIRQQIAEYDCKWQMASHK